MPAGRVGGACGGRRGLKEGSTAVPAAEIEPCCSTVTDARAGAFLVASVAPFPFDFKVDAAPFARFPAVSPFCWCSSATFCLTSHLPLAKHCLTSHLPLAKHGPPPLHLPILNALSLDVGVEGLGSWGRNRVLSLEKLARKGTLWRLLLAHPRQIPHGRSGSTSIVVLDSKSVQRCWSGRYCLGARAPAVLPRGDDNPISRSARAGGSLQKCQDILPVRLAGG
jgi:hypothetical protein